MNDCLNFKRKKENIYIYCENIYNYNSIINSKIILKIKTMK